jgi:SAM-dependent methyltransferase
MKKLKRVAKGAYLLASSLPFISIGELGRTAQAMKGVHQRSCPICGYRGYFKTFGFQPRFDARCPSCSSLERHRLLYLALTGPYPIAPNAEVLHFAPEKALRSFLKGRVQRYVTTDIIGTSVDVALNIEAIDLPDASFDVILCNHVLEHVDDRAALAEMHRVLRPGGTLYAMVPLVEGWAQTYEPSGIHSDDARRLHYGQHDHVRFYGQDFRERIRAAGFTLDEFTAEGTAVVEHGLVRGEKVFIGHQAG